MRLCFFNKFHMLTKHYGMVSHLILFQSNKFDDKVKAVKDSNENSSDVIEKYQVRPVSSNKEPRIINVLI